MVKEMSPEQAIVIVAAQVLSSAAKEALWEDSPDIGENDWIRIMGTMAGMAPEPEGFDEAIELLEKRATEWTGTAEWMPAGSSAENTGRIEHE